MEADRPLGRGAAHPLWPLFVLIVGAAVLVLVLAHPAVDESWENHPATSGWCYGGGDQHRDRLRHRRGAAAAGDARLFLVSLGFLAAAGFLGLHALATPGVLLDANGGFVLATPVGLVVAGARGGLGCRWTAAAERVLSWAWLLTVGLFVLMAIWAVDLACRGPAALRRAGNRAAGRLADHAGRVGVVLYAAAAIGYAALYRRRREPFLLVVALAFALLAEAMFAIAWARNWRVSWWEWHVLMLVAFVTIAIGAAHRVARGALQPPLPRRDHRGHARGQRAVRRPAGLHLSAERPAARVAAMLNGYFGRLVPLLEARAAWCTRSSATR